jgi:hypothetical protein
MCIFLIGCFLHPRSVRNAKIVLCWLKEKKNLSTASVGSRRQLHEAGRCYQIAARRARLLPSGDDGLEAERELQSDLLLVLEMAVVLVGLADVGPRVRRPLAARGLLRAVVVAQRSGVFVVVLLFPRGGGGHRRRHAPAAGLVRRGGGRRRRALELGARGAEERVVAAVVLGDVADVAGAERRRGGGLLGLVRGRGGPDDDGVALEHGLDGGLARLPLARPEQTDGAVDRVDDAAAGLVEQGAEDGRAEGVGRGCGQEVEQPRAAVELGEEDGGVGLRLGGLDPLQARADGAGVAAALPQHPAPVAAHPHLCVA